MISRPLACLFASTLVLAAGCSSSSSSSSPTDGGSADGGTGGGQTAFTAAQLCALVSTADVSSAAGETMNDGVPSGVNSPSCNWQSPDSQRGATIAGASLSQVGVLPYGLQNTPGAHVDTIPNLGDSASFAAGPTGPNGEIDLAKNGRAVTITLGESDNASYDQAAQKAAELALAQAAVKNM